MSQSVDVPGADLSNQPWKAKCVCGKQFRQPNSYALHVGCCTKFKHRLGQRLSDARQRKRGASSLEHSESPHTASINGSEGNSGNIWGRKRKPPTWIDDDNLDVDIIVLPPAATATGTTFSDSLFQPAVCHMMLVRTRPVETECTHLAADQPRQCALNN